MSEYSIIESSAFFRYFGDSNSINVIIARLEADATVRLLVERMRADTRSAEELLERVKRLMSVAHDRNVLHPFDHSIMAYLHAVRQANSGIYDKLSQLVGDSDLPGLWYSREYVVRYGPTTGRTVTVSKVGFDFNHELGEPKRVSIAAPTGHDRRLPAEFVHSDWE